MTTKYPGIEVSWQVIDNERERLINQIWKLIPMREKAEDWEGHLIVTLEEIAGLGKVLLLTEKPDFLILLSKLEGLTEKYCDEFMFYRKTVFRCIDLLVKVLPHE